MGAYILKRILLMIPTLLGIMLMTFAVIQFVPGGPVEQVIAKMQGNDTDSTGRISGNTGNEAGGNQAQMTPGSDAVSVKYRGAQGLDPEFIKSLEKQFGFDKPAPERFLLMIKDYLTFNFGQSYFRDRSVISLILEKMPVSISLGLWLTLIQYLVSIPLGIRKAVKDGSTFDVWTSGVIIIGYAIPSFIFAIMLIVVFAGGSYYSWFPLRGLTSDNFDQLSFLGKIGDYAWHLTLPLFAMAIGSFATMTMLTKNSFLDEIRKQYVTTARAKGLSENAGALWPRLPQCHAAGDCGLPRRLHRRLLRQLAADRDHLLARRPRLSVLQGDRRPRLSDRLRQPLHLHADRASSCSSSRTSPIPGSIRASISRSGTSEPWRSASAPSTSDAGSCSGRTGAASGRSGCSWCCS